MSVSSALINHADRPEDWPEYEFARATASCSMCAWSKHLYGEETPPDTCPRCLDGGPEYLRLEEAMKRAMWSGFVAMHREHAARLLSGQLSAESAEEGS